MTRLALLGLALAACTTYDVPANPSFQVDVMPVLAGSCLRCHGYPVLTAPPHTRWDTFENLRVDDGVTRKDVCSPDDNIVCGASAMAGAIAERVQPGMQSPNDGAQMPPRFPLDDVQLEMLVRWSEQGGVRGAPRAGNQPPTVVVESTEIAGTAVTLRLVVDDADHDLVAGDLLAGTDTFVATLRSGHLVVAWTAPGPGSYALRARVDDGAGFVELPLGTVDVAPAGR